MCVYLPKDDHVYELEKGISNLVIYGTTQNPRPLKNRASRPNFSSTHQLFTVALV